MECNCVVFSKINPNISIDDYRQITFSYHFWFSRFSILPALYTEIEIKRLTYKTFKMLLQQLKRQEINNLHIPDSSLSNPAFHLCLKVSPKHANWETLPFGLMIGTLGY